ncbi:hypothetical protein MCOR02_001678 [Pyricularia oryzae]|nr:hypothetical protein MCOR02_001678 [Pyricularia oryzae]
MTDSDWKGLADGSVLDPDVGVVLAGLDFHINYLKIAHAYQYLRRGAAFIASNTDSTLPMSGNFFRGGVDHDPHRKHDRAPAVGARQAQPGHDGRRRGQVQAGPSRTCMIGDRLDTDIKFGIEGKLGGTLAVQTGVNKKEDWEKEDAVARPAFYVDKLSDLLAAGQ